MASTSSRLLEPFHCPTSDRRQVRVPETCFLTSRPDASVPETFPHALRNSTCRSGEIVDRGS
jgi:hypothetical protein